MTLFTKEIPMIGYLLITLAYMTRIPFVYKRLQKEPTLLIGTVILISSYFILAKHKFDKKDYDDPKKHYINLPYGFLALFFIFAYFIPLNITVRFYDIFAAFGYSLLFVASMRPEKVILQAGLIIIAVYYICGGLVKLFEFTFEDILLLVGRLLLAAYSIKLFTTS